MCFGYLSLSWRENDAFLLDVENLTKKCNFGEHFASFWLHFIAHAQNWNVPRTPEFVRLYADEFLSVIIVVECVSMLFGMILQCVVVLCVTRRRELSCVVVI